MSLDKYRQKRQFGRTPEPEGQQPEPGEGRRFVVQKHHARRLHYDFRLEIGGVLKSWAVPKGPSLDPKEKRLAVHVEDHPLDYADFEGTIPAGEYGAGTVIVWDLGTWQAESDLEQDYRKGKLKFRLDGTKLQGGWTLVRMRGKAQEKADNWLLIKERDDEARPLEEYDVLDAAPESALSGRTIQGIANKSDRDRKSQKQSATKTKKKSSSGTAATKKRLQQIAGATRASLPQKIVPQLAHLEARPPEGSRWLHEIKFDGYRLLAHIEQGQATLRTRNHHDWTDRFPDLAEALSRLPVSSAVLDGEVVALSSSGISRFQDLQNAFRKKETGQLVYQVFDLLYLDGFDLRKAPLEERKQLLRELLAEADQTRLQYTDHIEGQGPEFFQQCCRLGLEGVLSKRRDRPYRSGRTNDWIKVKCIERDEFVIGGYTPPAGSRVGLGALLVGFYNSNGELVYAGRVGTGFSEDVLIELTKRLTKLEQDECPFAVRPKSADRKTRWVEPLLVAQVEYGSWTKEGILRHPAFQGLREDLPARSVVRESENDQDDPTGGTKVKRRSSSKPKPKEPERELMTDAKLAELAQVPITSPEKLLYADVGITKLALASYYVQVSDWILPHLADRPVSLVRCPEGAHAECFYQKHAGVGTPEALRRVTIPEKEKKGQYLVVDNLPALASLVQIGVLEIHPWSARTDRIDRPDRMIFDLDPDESVPWSRVIEAAVRVREFLEALGLVSFVKTTGGKGLHVVVPIQRRHDWDEVKAFSEAVAKSLAAESPREYTATMSKAARKGKIYIDYQRNNRGATAVAAYSTRARSGAPVAVPLFWEELSPAIGPDHFHVGNVPARLAALDEDPWAEMFEVSQSLTTRAKKQLRLR